MSSSGWHRINWIPFGLISLFFRRTLVVFLSFFLFFDHLVRPRCQRHASVIGHGLRRVRVLVRWWWWYPWSFMTNLQNPSLALTVLSRSSPMNVHAMHAPASKTYKEGVLIRFLLFLAVAANVILLFPRVSMIRLSFSQPAWHHHIPVKHVPPSVPSRSFQLANFTLFF